MLDQPFLSVPSVLRSHCRHTWNLVDGSVDICDAVQHGLAAGGFVGRTTDEDGRDAGCKDSYELEEAVTQHDVLGLEDGQPKQVPGYPHDGSEATRPPPAGHKAGRPQADQCAALRKADPTVVRAVWSNTKNRWPGPDDMSMRCS